MTEDVILTPVEGQKQAKGAAMKFFEARADIFAPPEAVWQVLIDPARLSAGGFGIVSVSGDMRLGGKLTLFSELTPRPFKVKVATFTPAQEMVWQGGMPLGLFTGTRRFTLRAQQGGTAFHMREEFSGLMLPLIWKSMPDLTASFSHFAQTLKRISEENQ